MNFLAHIYLSGDNTGVTIGNFMADGFGTAFSSKLVLDENGPGGQFNVTVKTELEVKNIMFDWMGIDPDKTLKDHK